MNVYEETINIQLLYDDPTKYDWIDVVQTQTLSEEDIVYFKDLIDFKLVSKYQKLSESFIEEYSDILYWDHISRYQLISIEFIDKHDMLIHPGFAAKYQKLSDWFIKKHKGDINIVYVYLFHHRCFPLYTKHKLFNMLTGLLDAPINIDELVEEAFCFEGPERLKVNFTQFMMNNNITTIKEAINIIDSTGLTRTDLEYFIKCRIRNCYK
jgi:hypothetical protein